MFEWIANIDPMAFESSAMHWLRTNVLVLHNAIQLGIIALGLAVAWVIGSRLRPRIDRMRESRPPGGAMSAFLQRLSALAVAVVLLAFLWIAATIVKHSDMPNHVLRTVASLTNAWVVINLASVLIRNQTMSRLIAWAAWTLAALSTLGLFEATVGILDSLAIVLGGARISVLMVVKGILVLVGLLWAAFAFSNLFEARINRVSSLTPSVQVLMGKLTKISLISVAIVVALNAIGVDLTALTVFGGALGVGIGFGLQKIISNLVSGVILLMDKSIKPGDVIAVGDTYGWIVSLGARYAAVRTRDGTDHLIPNEELILQRVENWSHTDKSLRLRIPVGISYNADVRVAIECCLEAAAVVPRVLKSPETKCLLKGFGDSSVDLEIRIWINDPANGRSNVISEVLLEVWDRFHHKGVEIPFPQRDLHLRSVFGRSDLTTDERDAVIQSLSGDSPKRAAS